MEWSAQIILWPNAPESYEEEPYKNFGGRDYQQAQVFDRSTAAFHSDARGPASLSTT